MMSSPALKSFVLSGELSSFSIKTALVISTAVSFSLFLYLAIIFSDQLSHYNNYQKIVYSTSNNVSDESSDETDITHILFGISGAAKTWNDRRQYVELWWDPNITRGFVWLDENPVDYPWPSTSPPYRISGDTTGFNYTCWYGSRTALRMTRIIKESFELGLDNVRWFVLGDDDTVFFTHNLVDVLAKYDHNQMYYIGANSESMDQDTVHSYTTAFGGAGIAISYPLAVELVRILDGCIERYADFYGSDSKLQGCLSEIGVPITIEPGFHQVDVRGNAYGLLAAHPLAPLVSLHHLGYVQSLFPGLDQIDSLKKLTRVYKRDPSRTLQHSFCCDMNRKWSISVSWGYTIQLYPWLVNAKELETVFQTFEAWASPNSGSFTFNTRPVSLDPCERPILYFLDQVDPSGRNQYLSTTTYIKYEEQLEKDCDRVNHVHALSVKYFNVSASEFNPNRWRKARRRQCCEVSHNADYDIMDDGMMIQVHIRDCNQFERVTP